jgi:hypothetical protein
MAGEQAIGTGTAYFGQAEVAYDPLEDRNIVTLGFLKRWQTEQTGLPTGVGTLFPNVDATAQNSGVYVNTAGVLTKPVSLEEANNANKVIGYLRDNLLYLDGMFVRDMRSADGNFVVPGVDYWLQSNGSIGPSETSTPNTWSVRIGRGIATGIMYVDISVEGLT